MSTLIFDIETVGEAFDDMDKTTQHLLTRWVKDTSQSDMEYARELEVIKDRLGFSPYTGAIVAIGMYDLEQAKGAVYVDAGKEAIDGSEGSFVLRSMGEKAMLEAFWERAARSSVFVTFNGYGFDVPFILIRGAVHGVKPTKNLMANRYLSSQWQHAKHIDLLDQLTFYNAVRKKPSLHLVCRAFGITSPKADGISGDDVGRLYADKQYEKIARYNAHDVLSTAEVYKRWKEYVSFERA